MPMNVLKRTKLKHVEVPNVKIPLDHFRAYVQMGTLITEI